MHSQIGSSEQEGLKAMLNQVLAARYLEKNSEEAFRMLKVVEDLEKGVKEPWQVEDDIANAEIFKDSMERCIGVNGAKMESSNQQVDNVLKKLNRMFDKDEGGMVETLDGLVTLNSILKRGKNKKCLKWRKLKMAFESDFTMRNGIEPDSMEEPDNITDLLDNIMDAMGCEHSVSLQEAKTCEAYDVSAYENDEAYGYIYECRVKLPVNDMQKYPYEDVNKLYGMMGKFRNINYLNEYEMYDCVLDGNCLYILFNWAKFATRKFIGKFFDFIEFAMKLEAIYGDDMQ